MEAFRESEVLWWVLLDDYIAGSKKKIILRVKGGADHQKDSNYTFGSLKASMSTNSATMEAFMMSKGLWLVLLRVLS